MTSGAAAPGPRIPSESSATPIEVWGGIECTVNRVGDRYFDQLTLSGHDRRIPEDITRFHELGIRTLRYPVLWERVAPDSVDTADWSEPDLALEKMRELGIRPIVGLLHHGSGPRHTSLVDPDFARKLAEFAGAVARRYPWVDMYTPINEPLTTARFSALYGHWFPHACDDRSFAHAVLNQCDAIRKAMASVRDVNPNAQLVQTEDLGRTYSTPSLAYQATFDNNRRWLTFDILTGRLDEWHPLWWYLLESGITRQELESFLSRPCVPDIVGINHYVTSDRFLDEGVEQYPPHCRGSNGRHAYADVEAVRTLEQGVPGHTGALREAWQRYALPLAVTEVHLGCTREEQLRWLHEAWKAANTLKSDGIDVRAVTIWSLLGGYGWCSLLTGDFDSYEPAAYDLRSPKPRPTALATMTRALATTGEFDHPVLDGEGWWRRPVRLTHSSRNKLGLKHDEGCGADRPQRPIMLTGCRGTLGRAVQRIAKNRGLAVHGIGRTDLDICDPHSVSELLARIRPWALINAAGYVRVDDAEQDAENCYHVNTEGARVLAEECVRLGIRYATFSSDLVFDGAKSGRYLESDAVRPLNVYGTSKARMEGHLDGMDALIIRTSAFFGPWDAHNFLATTFHELTHGRVVCVANDIVVSPTYVPDLVNATLDLIIDGERGLWHLANDGALTWYEFARKAAEKAQVGQSLLVGRPMSEIGLRARRPLNSSLASERGKLMPSIDDAIDRWLGAVRSSQMERKLLEETSGV